MKCSDLQMGDWVCITAQSRKGNIKFMSPNLVGVAMYLLRYDQVSPIPLTLEILERNGFELRDGFLYHRIDDKPHHYDFKLRNGGVFTSEGYTLECGIYHLTIRYVHELQHALRLCGLNDLADNFKLEE